VDSSFQFLVGCPVSVQPLPLKLQETVQRHFRKDAFMLLSRAPDEEDVAVRFIDEVLVVSFRNQTNRNGRKNLECRRSRRAKRAIPAFSFCQGRF